MPYLNKNEVTLLELSSLTLPGLTAWMATLSEPAFRAKQLYGWLHQKQVTSFDAMSNLSLPLRSKLSENGFITKVSTIQRLTSRLDGTNKFLMELADGNCVEAVWMEYKHGVSLCISTQVGCRQGCTFCASTLGGLLRNLTPGEMLGEIYEAQRQMGKQISTLVLMGIGEPLDNFDNVMDFLEILSSPQGQNMSLRHVSLSTCGLVPEIKRLQERNLGLTLSISLHASNDETRDSIMPINKKYNIDALMSACKDYFEATGRRISYEYALIAGVNDSEAQALRLVGLLRGQNCHVNLIPVNPVKERNTRR
ncbi:MAG: 23S rRNA (adenine(2503)-C(2))-methyltransferase RlmN, partial [Angelakisella sp.]